MQKFTPFELQYQPSVNLIFFRNITPVWRKTNDFYLFISPDRSCFLKGAIKNNEKFGYFILFK